MTWVTGLCVSLVFVWQCLVLQSMTWITGLCVSLVFVWQCPVLQSMIRVTGLCVSTLSFRPWHESLVFVWQCLVLQTRHESLVFVWQCVALQAMTWVTDLCITVSTTLMCWWLARDRENSSWKQNDWLTGWLISGLMCSYLAPLCRNIKPSQWKKPVSAVNRRALHVADDRHNVTQARDRTCSKRPHQTKNNRYGIYFKRLWWTQTKQ